MSSINQTLKEIWLLARLLPMALKSLKEDICSPIYFCDDVCEFCGDRLVSFEDNSIHKTNMECIICRSGGTSKYAKIYYKGKHHKDIIIIGEYKIEKFISKKEYDTIYKIKHPPKSLKEKIGELDFETGWIYVGRLNKNFNINFTDELKNDKKIESYLQLEEIYK